MIQWLIRAQEITGRAMAITALLVERVGLGGRAMRAVPVPSTSAARRPPRRTMS